MDKGKISKKIINLIDQNAIEHIKFRIHTCIISLFLYQGLYSMKQKPAPPSPPNVLLRLSAGSAPTPSPLPHAADRGRMGCREWVLVRRGIRIPPGEIRWIMRAYMDSSWGKESREHVGGGKYEGTRALGAIFIGMAESIESFCRFCLCIVCLMPRCINNS